MNKTKREVLSETIALLFFAILSFAIQAHDTEYNSKFFLRQAENLHLKNPIVLAQYKFITNARKELDTVMKYDSKFSKYLDEICDNIVGNTMLKMLIANARAFNLSTLYIEIDKKDQFLPSINTIQINPDLYRQDGYYQDAFYGVDRQGALVKKKLTMSDAIFHELCHAFHTYSDVAKFETDYLDVIYAGRQEEKYLWTNRKSDNKFEDDEEMYTITGYYWNSGRCFDPISCNMFDICKHSSKPESITQRVFHKRIVYIQESMPTCSLSYKIDRFLIDVTKYVLT
jgi:hypothetical protein